MPGFFKRLLAACGIGGPKDLTTKYLEFYYPVTNRTFYEIAYDWGICLITMCGAPDEEAHEDSRPYLGYAVHRPIPSDPADRGKHPTFVVTPEAMVWRLTETGDIPASSERQEVTEEKSESGTMTQTTTIRSEAEPVIDHFLAQPDAWTKHGVLEKTGGGYRLRQEEPA